VAVLAGGERGLPHGDQAGALAPLDPAGAPAAALLIGQLGALAPLDPLAVAAGALPWGTGHASQDSQPRIRGLRRFSLPLTIFLSLSLLLVQRTCCGEPKYPFPPKTSKSVYIVYFTPATVPYLALSSITICQRWARVILSLVGYRYSC
jgi:hypothetical protein